MRSRAKISWNSIVFTVLLVQVFIIQWLRMSYYYLYVIDIVLVMAIAGKTRSIKKPAPVLISVIGFILYTMLQCIRSLNIRILRSNYHTLIPVLLLLLYLYMQGDNIDNLRGTMKRIFIPVNLYMIVNVPVMILEMQGMTALSGRRLAKDIENKYLPDLISGLFGYQGTPTASVFCCFFFVFDLWYFRNFVKRNHRRSAMVYYFIMLAFYLYIALPSENKAFYIVMALAFLIYYQCVNVNDRKIVQKIKSHLRILEMVGVAIVGAIIAYNSSEEFAYIVDSTVGNFLAGLQGTNNVVGGSERLGVINYYLRNNINKPFGVGLSAMFWQEEMAFGFVHFGINDMGSFLVIGGYTLILLLLVVLFLTAKRMSRSVYISICLTCFFFVLIVYTQVVTNISTFIGLALFMVVCAIEAKSRADVQVEKGKVKS